MNREISGTIDSEMEYQDKIFFVGDGSRIPLSQFLREEKIRREEDLGRRVTWKEMDKICGVKKISAYALNNTQGHPNNPKLPNLIKIINSLSKSESDFEFPRNLRIDVPITELGIEEYWSAMRGLGDYLLQVNENLPAGKIQKLSCPAIKRIAGERFYSRHGRTKELREQMIAELNRMDDGKYSSLELQNQVQNKPNKLKTWSNNEVNLLTDILLDFVENNAHGKYLPKGVYKSLFEEFKNLGFDRTYNAVVGKSREIWKGVGKTMTFTRGSPESYLKSLEEAIEDSVSDLALEEDQNIIETGDVKKYLENSSYGHQALVAYLMDPVNYKTKLGEDAKLVSVDFHDFDTPSQLFEEHKAKLENLETTPNDEEIKEIVDGWLRVDMLFKNSDGHYSVVEVKQNAVNSENYDNADKSRQQIAAYVAVVSDNIKYVNATTYGKPISEKVSGILAAHTVSEDLEDYLSNQQDRGLVIIPREDVLRYVGSFQPKASNGEIIEISSRTKSKTLEEVV